MTYSIVARDPGTGELGVAVQSHWFSVGSVVSWARPGVGAVATQSVAEVAHGPNALAIYIGTSSAAYPAMEQYLCTVGRTYLVKAIYVELAKTQEGHQLADKIYAKAKPGYHSITQQAVERVLGKTGG